MGADDGAGIAVVAALGEVGDDVRLAERAHRLQRQQFGIAGAGADADQAACLVDVTGLASRVR